MVNEAVREIGAPIELYCGGFSDAGSADAFAVTAQEIGGARMMGLAEFR
jgi:hypothetical protein